MSTRSKLKELRLNVGCGFNKIKSCINIDSAKSCNPDIRLDITKDPLPWKKDTISEIFFFHCIEHVQKRLHKKVLLEFQRVLKPEGKLYISYPNFWECAIRWKANTDGQRDFWEATLYGRQLYPGDFHVCAMNPDELTSLLYECGFKDVSFGPEPEEKYNTITLAIKGKEPVPSYEIVIARDMQNMLVRQN